MKPRQTVMPIPTDEELAPWFSRMESRGIALHNCLAWTSKESDRRDADLMLGLTGHSSGVRGVTVAECFELGCVIYSTATGKRIAKRWLFERAGLAEESDITYFA